MRRAAVSRRTAGGLLAAVAVALLAPLAVPAAGPAYAAPDAHTVFEFHDDRIDASSGLAILPDVHDFVFTVNDHMPTRVFGVRPSDGISVATMRLQNADNVNWEAVAPGSGRTLWVGDIGDNDEDRSEITVYRFEVPDPPSTGFYDADAYTFTYPDGPHDAEALLVNPVDDTMYIATKDPEGGTLYRAPDLDSGDEELEKVGSVPAEITDGAFRPDGRQFVLRSYTTAYVYSAPGEKVGSFALPDQEQGEGITYSRSGKSLLLSSEGVHTPVLRLKLSDVLDTSSASSSASTSEQPTATAGAGGRVGKPQDDGAGWVNVAFIVGPFLIALVAAAAVLLARGHSPARGGGAHGRTPPRQPRSRRHAPARTGRGRRRDADESVPFWLQD